jgi:hypothetical protein
MKNIKLLFLILLFFPSLQILEAQKVNFQNEVVSAINSGNANRLSPFLGNNIELAIGNKNDIYSKQQTIEIVSDFFKRNSVVDFKILHSGNKDTSNFVIGTLKTTSSVFRVYILARQLDGKTIIQQLRIEPSNE